ncbi:Demethylrebeccamycin-D-glucose O-methyltransferase [Rubripirellula obstinata]|uniref:Demethylrebeccamycin-D-glucose O-methyltransferase n=1 Tax=Rubripirellula obstinata TaxID=406547 RepID=A0A5B1CJ06_9BACT|nr:class I SAM-dependent methyltransferase [Rubripirellula obstinata]KAA1259709.1 Demethylrebeccamycin-D-glucose O-methyltransferase [Rubripirellula obstinata]
MTLPRTPEPIADPKAESDLYRQMDHNDVNGRFVSDLLSAGKVGKHVVDLGCGPADIPIKLVTRIQELGQELEQDVQVMGIDFEPEMLTIAKEEIDFAGMIGQIILEQADASNLVGFDDAMADTVISNTFLHHLDHPVKGMAEAVRILKPSGRLFIRDLYRPETAAQVEDLVALHAGNENNDAKQMLRQSLHAALTLEEITSIAKGLGISNENVVMTSDRHWTIDWTKPNH